MFVSIRKSLEKAIRSWKPVKSFNYDIIVLFVQSKE
jgi:hypothetical protein